MAAEPWTTTIDGVVIDIRLTPRGGRDAIEGIERRADGRSVFKARVRAAAFEGAANTALCRLVAKVLDVAPRDVTVAGGTTSRAKRVRVIGEPGALVAAPAAATHRACVNPRLQSALVERL